MAVAVPRARDSVHVREACSKIKERRDTKQNRKHNLQNLYYFNVILDVGK